jgi:hypothetical protein
MARCPGDRYAAPRTLAGDIEHWLADEPVSAYLEPWAGRARRWTNRHRTLVTAGAAALAVALVCLSTALILLSAANLETRAARDLALRREREAERQRDAAQAKFTSPARRSMSIAQSLARTPGSRKRTWWRCAGSCCRRRQSFTRSS